MIERSANEREEAGHSEGALSRNTLAALYVRQALGLNDDNEEAEDD